MSSPNSHGLYQFGPYRLEVKERRLLRGERPVPLAGKAFETLCFLVQRHGSLVPKDELLTAIWPETAVEENNIDRNISTLRKVLGEKSAGHRYIETVPRIGYRFVATVTQLLPVNPGASPAPRDPQPDSPNRQVIRFCVSPDNVRLAYAKVGCGFPIVRVANCFNHLGFEWESPIWHHWVRDLAVGNCIVRYDGRGNGLSEWNVENMSFDTWLQDLETVVDAAGLSKFALMGHSQGGAVAIAYAVKHPERVSHLILCGAYSRGANFRGRPEAAEVRHALETLVQLNWGKSNPSFFQLVTNLYIPENTTEEEQEWFKELQLISVTNVNLVRFMRACDDINIRPLLSSVSVPTLVFHADRDRIAPAEEGRILAAEIPGAKFVPLSTSNHILVAAELSWEIFRSELAAFLQNTCSSSSASS